MIKNVMVVLVVSLAACASTQKPAPAQTAQKSMFGEDCAKTCDAKHEADCYSMCKKMYGAPSVAR